MKGMREIRGRIKAVKSTGQITHAMQLVASSKMRKAQIRAENGRAYNLLMLDLMDLLQEHSKTEITHPIFTERPVKKRLVIVFSTDKGLCGPLNSNLFKLINSIKEPCEYIAVGSKAARYIIRTGRELVAQFKLSDYVPFNEIKVIVKCAIQELLEKRADTIEILYPAFINTLKQDPAIIKIAPVSDLDPFINQMREKYKSDLNIHKEDDRPLLVEPSKSALLAQLPLYYINNTIYHLALDAKASEHSARMVSMKGASDNADSLIADLTLQYNKARQESITNEIIELSSGVNTSE